MLSRLKNLCKNASSSIRKRMLAMMLLLTTVTIFIFVLLVLLTRLLPSLNDNAYRSMYEQSSAQASRISMQMKSITNSVWRTTADLKEDLDNLLEEQEISFDELNMQPHIVEQYLSDSFARLTALLDEQDVSGAFVILDTKYISSPEHGRAALYLRQAPQALSTSASSNSTITLLRGPSSISNQQDLALDKSWSYSHSFRDDESALFFTNPVQAAAKYTGAVDRDLGYWSTRFYLSLSDVEVVTYTIPMRGASGDIYGVCGIELSLNALARIAPATDLPFADGFYLFGHFINNQLVRDSAIAYDSTGAAYMQATQGNLPAERVSNSPAYAIYSLQNGADTQMLAAVVNIDLYERNSPFTDEEYRLLIVAPRQQVLAQSLQVSRDILVMLLISAILSVAGAVWLSRSLAKRVQHLAVVAANLNPEKPVTLPRTKIRELDILSGVLEKMNADVAAHAARMSTIVDSVGIAMGAFEINIQKDTVFLTDSLYRLLDIPHSEEDSQYMSRSEFVEILPQVDAPDNEAFIDFCWKEDDISGEKLWLRLNRNTNADFIYGTVLDISREVTQKAQLEYERNYDPLTKLLNRNAYPELMENRIKAAPDKMGVLLFGDLDNLKVVNDTYGHDVGDRYIQLAAEGLNMFANEGGVVARVSGDEFAVYLHGGSSRAELRQKVDALLQQMRDRQMIMPDNSVQKVRVSVGLAYYPDDGNSIEELIRYADFAMYEIKHTSKGGTRDFDHIHYQRKIF